MTEQPHGYALWAVLAPRMSDSPRTSGTKSLKEQIENLGSAGVTVRGIYDVSGLREAAELMIWLHGDVLEDLQAALRDLRGCPPFHGRELAWSAAGAHRAAEFSRDHIPSFLRGLEPKGWLCVYPFVRSYEWYLLPEEERAALLREHGLKGREHGNVQPNTVSAFGLHDYEWLLALEADDPLDLIDLMRDIRATGARRHVRLETPFYTGRAMSVAEVTDTFS